MIKTSESCILPISGIIEENNTIVLTTGWNLMPVLSETEIDIAELFAPFGNKVIIVKEATGFGVFWPAMAINTIGQVQPGNAYYVKVSEEVTVEFPQ